MRAARPFACAGGNASNHASAFLLASLKAIGCQNVRVRKTCSSLTAGRVPRSRPI
jgi:hypothetical protein